MVRRIGASGPGPSGAPWKRVCIKKVWTFCVRLVLKLGIYFFIVFTVVYFSVREICWPCYMFRFSKPQELSASGEGAC